MTASGSPRRRIPGLAELASLARTAARHRFALARVEADEAGEQVFRFAALVCGVLALAGAGMVSLTLLVAALAWDSPYRAWWIGAMALVEFAAALGGGLFALHRFRAWRPFPETRLQLDLDHQWLDNFSPDSRP
ncbi:MAG TPA: phage holin family protein [Lacunisphaera sp.]|jgi:uncharacterized membrane protein YqjE|nr:phage holin family protein [Lacunisphaera sp.]